LTEKRGWKPWETLSVGYARDAARSEYHMDGPVNGCFSGSAQSGHPSRRAAATVWGKRYSYPRGRESGGQGQRLPGTAGHGHVKISVVFPFLERGRLFLPIRYAGQKKAERLFYPGEGCAA